MIFGKLFKNKKLNQPVDLSGLVTDMHSHLIPGIDDGSPDLETSVELVKRMSKLGYKKLITTPHVMADLYKNTPEIIEEGLHKLNTKLKEEGITTKIEAAAEYLLDDGFEKLLNNNALRTFGDNYLLVELPHFNPPPNLYELSFELQVRGIKIILAHPERYLYWHHDFNKFQELKDRGIFFQLNTLSLSGHYSQEVRKMGEKMIDLEMIDFLGSDLHNLQYLETFENTLYEPYLEKIVLSGKLKNHLL